MSKNQALLEGVVGQDPKIRAINDTWTAFRFSVAWKSRKKEGGKWVDGDTNWLNVELWTKSPSDFEWIKKGVIVDVDGFNVARTYTDGDGNRKTAYAIKSFENVKQIVKGQKKQQDTTTETKDDNDDMSIPF